MSGVPEEGVVRPISFWPASSRKLSAPFASRSFRLPADTLCIVAKCHLESFRLSAERHCSNLDTSHFCVSISARQA